MSPRIKKTIPLLVYCLNVAAVLFGATLILLVSLSQVGEDLQYWAKALLVNGSIVVLSASTGYFSRNRSFRNDIQDLLKRSDALEIKLKRRSKRIAELEKEVQSVHAEFKGSHEMCTALVSLLRDEGLVNEVAADVLTLAPRDRANRLRDFLLHSRRQDVLQSQSESKGDLKLRARIDELRSLNDGWLDGEGQAPSGLILSRLHVRLLSNFPAELYPRIYPTEDGGVLLEWLIDRLDVSLEISPNESLTSWHVLDLDTEKEDTRMINPSHDDEWKQVADYLAKLEARITE